eukprot:148539-Chlamydomonas_euryale.AAC.3
MSVQVLINTLNTSKATSQTISARVAEAEQTERQINEARNVYRSLPTRGSLLYFVVADLVRRAALGECVEATQRGWEEQVLARGQGRRQRSKV